jgi:hypothetical protein
MVKISTEWVTGPEQGKSNGRIATFSLWTSMFRDGKKTLKKTIIKLYNTLALLCYMVVKLGLLKQGMLEE